MVWLKSSIAAAVAAVAFAPVVCLSEIGETTNGATEITRCNGLLPIPSNVALMVVMSAVAFLVTFWWTQRREGGRSG